LRGGTSNEYEHSLKTGAAILDALPEERYNTRDIFIDKRGVWHMRGMPVVPTRALSQVDVVVNGLHGGVGEDGTVARLLERTGIPYVGSGALSSAQTFNKILAREVMTSAGIRMPNAMSFSLSHDLDTQEMANHVFSQFGPPYVVKAPNEGASHGIQISPTIIDLPHAIGDTLDSYGSVLVEEFLPGREAVVGVIEGYRGESFYTLPPARVLLPENDVMLHPRHYEMETVRYLVPSDFSSPEKNALAEIARTAHQALELSHFSLVGIIVARGKPYVIEVDTLPHLHDQSPFFSKLASVGSSIREFLEHVIQLVRR